MIHFETILLILKGFLTIFLLKISDFNSEIIIFFKNCPLELGHSVDRGVPGHWRSRRFTGTASVILDPHDDTTDLGFENELTAFHVLGHSSESHLCGRTHTVVVPTC